MHLCRVIDTCSKYHWVYLTKTLGLTFPAMWLDPQNVKNIVSEMIISPERLSSAVLLTLLAAVFPPGPLAGDPPSLLQTYWICFYRHITQILNQICFLIQNGCCPWDLVCSVNWIVLLGAPVPSGEHWYLWAPACSTGLRGDLYSDAGFMVSRWSILINSHLKQVEFSEVSGCRDNKSASKKQKHKHRDI